MAMNPRLLRPSDSTPYPLDTFGNAAAAYSLRRLSSNYNGPVVQVRRSSDNAEVAFNAEELSDGTFEEWRGGAPYALVRTLFDQSGNGRHFEQATATKQPTLSRVATSSGVLGMDFREAGFTAVMENEVLAITSTCSVLAVVWARQADPADGGYIFDNLTSTGFAIYQDPAFTGRYTTHVVSITGGNKRARLSSAHGLTALGASMRGVAPDERVRTFSPYGENNIVPGPINYIPNLFEVYLGAATQTPSGSFNGWILELIIYDRDMAHDRLVDQAEAYYAARQPPAAPIITSAESFGVGGTYISFDHSLSAVPLEYEFSFALDGVPVPAPPPQYAVVSARSKIAVFSADFEDAVVQMRAVGQAGSGPWSAAATVIEQ